METKLRRLIIGTFVTTFVLLVGMIVAWNMMLIRPLNQTRDAATTALEANRTLGKQLGENLAKKVKHEKNVILLNDQLEAYRNRFRSINYDFTTDAARQTTWRGLMTEYSREYGLALRQEVVDAAEESGVDITSSAKINNPDQKPEDVAVPGGFLKPVTGGTLSVSLEARSFNDVLRFLNRINKSRILMYVGNVKLEGYAPAIKVNMTLTPFLLTRGPAVKLPAAPSTGEKAAEAAGEAVEAATGGGGGGGDGDGDGGGGGDDA